jgi:hypothetical protein
VLAEKRAWDENEESAERAKKRKIERRSKLKAASAGEDVPWSPPPSYSHTDEIAAAALQSSKATPADGHHYDPHHGILQLVSHTQHGHQDQQIHLKTPQPSH